MKFLVLLDEKTGLINNEITMKGIPKISNGKKIEEVFSYEDMEKLLNAQDDEDEDEFKFKIDMNNILE